MQNERRFKFKESVFNALSLHGEGEPNLPRYLNAEVVKDFKHSDYQSQPLNLGNNLLHFVEEYRLLAGEFQNDRIPNVLEYRKKTAAFLNLIYEGMTVATTRKPHRNEVQAAPLIY